MSQIEKKSLAQSLGQAEAIVEALGNVFARALATYTVEVIALLQSRGLMAPEAEAPTDETVQGDELLDTAPEWVRESYERAKKGRRAVEVDEDEMRARLIRNRLALALKKQGMTQSALAKSLGKSPSQISRIFRHPERSQLNTLRSIADAIDVELSDILRGLDASQ
jgi:DNA-binding Xre family transcriptional regulator